MNLLNKRNTMLRHSILSLTPSLATIAATVMMYWAMWYVWPWSTPGGRGEIQEILGNSDLVNISYRWLHMVWTFYHWLHLLGIKHPSKILLTSLFLLITEKRAFLRVLILFPELIFAPYLTNVMFGPQIGVLIGKTQPNHVIQMKKSLCWVNVLLSLLGQEVPHFTFFTHI